MKNLKKENQNCTIISAAEFAIRAMELAQSIAIDNAQIEASNRSTENLHIVQENASDFMKLSSMLSSIIDEDIEMDEIREFLSFASVEVAIDNLYDGTIAEKDIVLLKFSEILYIQI